MSENHKSTSSSAICEKSGKTISTDEKLKVIRWLEKGEWIVNIYHNVRLAHSSLRAIRNNADRIKESAKSANKLLV